MDRAKLDGCELLPLQRMATRLGVPSRWLREQAELGKVPGLRAGDRWLFVPAMAGQMVDVSRGGAK
jgi:hypothetical protein